MMAIRPLDTAAFIDRLLAPLPQGEVPFDEKRYLFDLRADMKRVWHRESLLLSIDQAYHMYHALLGTTGRDAAWKRYVDLIDKQMARPAALRAHLRWKERHRNLDGGRPQWDVAIERDHAWIARLDAAGCGVRRAL